MHFETNSFSFCDSDFSNLGFLKNLRYSKWLVSLLHKTKSKISRWKTRPLSQAGRMVMIKTVLLVLPNYVMSCYRFPKKIILGFHSLISRFWYSISLNTKVTFWYVWDNLCKAKDMGSVGFRNIYYVNWALLEKNWMETLR